MDFCSYLDFSLPGRRFVLHNDNFVHLISFHIFSLFSWKAILPTQRYFCPFAFFSFFYCIFSGKAIITTQRCFRQFIVSFFIYRLMLVLISVLICVVILVWLRFMFIMVSISMLVLIFVIMLKLILLYFFLLVFSFWFWFRCWRFCLTLFMLILTLIVDAGFEIGCWLLMLLFILILFWI